MTPFLFSTYFAADGATLDILKKFAEKYVGAESGQAWKAFTGGGIFEIVLAARLVALGSVGLASDVSSEIHHADRLRNLGHHFLRLFGWLKLKQLYKQVEVEVGVDRKHQFEAEMPAMVRLTRGQLEDSGRAQGGAVVPNETIITRPGNLLSPPKTLNKQDLAKFKQEEFTANFLKAQGRRVEMNPLENVVGAGRQGDRLVDGFKTEFKRVTTGRVETVVDRVNKSLKRKAQARAIVVDTRGSRGGFTLEQAQQAVRGVQQLQRASRLRSLEIIGDNFIIRQGIRK